MRKDRESLLLLATKTVVVTLLLFTNVALYAESASNTIAPEIRFAAAGLKNASESMTCMQMQIVKEQKKTKKGLPAFMKGPDLVTKWEFEWQINGQNLYEHYDAFKDFQDKASSAYTLWLIRGVSYTSRTQQDNSIDHSKRIFSNGYITYSDGSLTEANFDRGAIYLDPRWKVFGSPSLSEDLLQEKYHATFKGYDTIKGHKCIKIDLYPTPSYMQSFWIDTNHGFVVYKQETSAKVNEKWFLTGIDQAFNVSEYGKTWLPEYIESKMYLPVKDENNTLTQPNLDEPQFESTYTIKNGVLGCKDIPPIIWPLGTEIVDGRTMESLTVVAVHNSELLKLNAMLKSDSLSPLQKFSFTEDDRNKLLKDKIGSSKIADMVAVALNDSYLLKLKALQAKP